MSVIPAPGRVALAALALNAVWEAAHWPLYECPFTVARWLRASAADAALTAATAAAAAHLGRGRPGMSWALLGGALTATAAGIELSAARRARWRYRPAMPTVGPVGLSPLAQLPLAGAVAVSLARRA